MKEIIQIIKHSFKRRSAFQSFNKFNIFITTEEVTAKQLTTKMIFAKCPQV